MSGLKGRTVRIVVGEPHDWNQGNLFGTIISAQGKTEAIVRLTKKIKGSKLTSDLLKVSTRQEGESLMVLNLNYSVKIAGILVTKDTNESDLILIGNMTFD